MRHLILAMIVCAAGAISLGGCITQPGTPEPPTSARADRFDRSLAAAAEFLIARQAPDGAWRSELYGPFKDGTALTPLVVQALQCTSPTPARGAACRRGIDFLAAFAQTDGSIRPGFHGFSYPVYTAAGAVVLLSGEGAKHRQARDAWLAYLLERQLTENLDWEPADMAYGGWGYCPTLPRKPPVGQPTPPLTESNLSATVAALTALRAAGLTAGHPAVQKALRFCERCQNFGDEPTFDDGGFHFIYDDGVRNKAGSAGRDGQGRERFASYGSTTADGLRALLLGGLSPDHPRVRAARNWLSSHFSAEAHPGRYPPEREQLRSAVYYYYACSVAHTLRQPGHEENKPVREDWSNALAEQLLSRQRDDGAWVNPQGFIREDEPLVATSFAVQALANCR